MSITTQRIRQLAREQRRSLSYLCDKIGVKSRTYFQDVEKRNGEIPSDNLEIFAKELNTTVEYLKGETDEKGPADSFSALFNQLSESEREIIRKAMEEIIKSRTTRN